MTKIRTFETVGLALHAPTIMISAFLNILRMHREDLPRREMAWTHVATSTETMQLTFGRAGLRNVIGGGVVEDLKKAGFGFVGAVIERKRARFSKKEDVAAAYAGLAGVHEGDHKWDERGELVWKECLQLQLSRDDVLRLDQPIHDNLAVLLKSYIWKRARIFEQFEPGSTTDGLALIELVGPKILLPQQLSDLHYSEERGFWSVRFPKPLFKTAP